MDKKYIPKTDFSDFSGPIETRGFSPGSPWWGRDDDFGMRHIPFPVGETSPKTSGKDKALDFIRNSLLVILGIVIVVKIISFFGEFAGRLIGWAASLLF